MSDFDCASAASATDTKGFAMLLSGAAHAKATDVQSNTAMIAAAIFLMNDAFLKQFLLLLL